MPKRILHLIGGGEIGGAEKYLLYLLENFDRNEVTPYLACLIKNSPFADLASSKGIATSIFPMRFPLDFTPALPIIRFCRKNMIDAIHTHGIRANLIGRTAAKILSLPSITTIHSIAELDYPSFWKGKAALILDDLTLPLSSGIITVSSALRKTAEQRLAKKKASIPLKTVSNGCPALNFPNKKKMKEEFRLKWNIPNDKIVLGTIGRLHPVKGQHYLIEAARILSREIPDIHLLFIGDGPSSGQLRLELEESGLPYTMTGFLPDAWQSLPAMDIFVLPSLSEGMGMVLLEAAQAGVPIVASRVGGIPDIVENESSGLLVTPADPVELALACSQLLQNSNLVKKLTANAKKRVQVFSIDNMVKETIIFYNTVLSDPISS